MAANTKKTAGTNRKSTTSAGKKTTTRRSTSSAAGTRKTGTARSTSGTSRSTSSRTQSAGRSARSTSSYSASNSRRRANQDAMMRRDLLIILLFAGMVFLFLSNFGIFGPAGAFFKSIMTGFCGFAAYFLPVFIFGCVLYYTAHSEDPITPVRLTGAVGLFIIFSSACELVSADLANSPLFDLSKIYVRCAESGEGGGILGGSVAWLLYHWFKNAGSVIVLILLGVICIVLISRESLIDKMNEKAARAREYREERRALQEQMRLEEEEYRQAHPEEFEEEDSYSGADKRGFSQVFAKRGSNGRKEYRYEGIVGDTRLKGYPEKSEDVLHYEFAPDGSALEPEQKIRTGAGEQTARAEEAPAGNVRRREDSGKAGAAEDPYAGYHDRDIYEYEDGAAEQEPQELPPEEYDDRTYDSYYGTDYEEPPLQDDYPLSEGDSLEPIGSERSGKKRSGFFGLGKSARGTSDKAPEADDYDTQERASQRLRRAGDIHEITAADYMSEEYDSILPIRDGMFGETLEDRILQESVSEILDTGREQKTAEMIAGPEHISGSPSSEDDRELLFPEKQEEQDKGDEEISYIPDKILTFNRQGRAVRRSISAPEPHEPVSADNSQRANHPEDFLKDTGDAPVKTLAKNADTVSAESIRPQPAEYHEPDPAPAEPAPIPMQEISAHLQAEKEISEGKAPADPGSIPEAGSEQSVQGEQAQPVITGQEIVQAQQDAAKATINAGGLAGADASSISRADAVTVAQAEETGTSASKPKPRFVPRDYIYPPMDLLVPGNHDHEAESENELRETAARLQMTLKTFGVNVKITDISQGPAVTRYELLPELGVKVSKIVGLQDDIKLQLAATDIRIEAPIPGKSAIGIEVPNKTTSIVALRDILETSEFRNHKSGLAFGVGKDIAGKSVISDIAKMPHVLIAGSTGSGKSVCINTIIMSILYHADPREVKLIMIDPKVVELSVYNGIPHLMIPVVTNPQKASAALNWAVAEMDARYRKFADAAVRDIKGYNALVKEREAAAQQGVPEEELPGNEEMQYMPQLVVIVDELADLMMVAKNDVETAICRLAQLARAAGIHLIIATQRPSVDVITGLIKANMPSRIAFAVSSGVDSRTILDMYGAEKLLGKGDMLFFPQGMTKPARVQGAFVSDDEVNEVVRFIKKNNPVSQDTEEIEKRIENMAGGDGGQTSDEALQEVPESRYDELFEKAGKFIIEKNNASIGLLQRMYRIGFNRAARIMDQLSEAGVVSESEGTKSRRILMTEMEFDTFCRENL